MELFCGESAEDRALKGISATWLNLCCRDSALEELGVVEDA
jgi:hypothetical protein